jgi:ribosomal protein S18 acetylase RimI-like enzyme
MIKRKYLFLIVDDNNHKIRDIAKFISQFQSNKRSLVSWLGNTATEIENQLREYINKQPRPFLQVALDDSGAIVGFLGIVFSDTNTVRLLGPYVTEIESEWDEISEELFRKILEKYKLWKNVSLRVAFTRKNNHLNKFCKAHGFIQYNAERTLMLEKHEWQRKESVTDDYSTGLVEIRPYRDADFSDFLNMHPKGAYFNAYYIVQNLNDIHHLIIASIGVRIVGYAYYEDFKADGFTEICFLNVLKSEQNKRIGTKLIKKAIEDSFPKSEIKKIQISVRLENTAAFRLYQRFGFKEVVTYFAYELKF